MSQVVRSGPVAKSAGPRRSAASLVCAPAPARVHGAGPVRPAPLHAASLALSENVGADITGTAASIDGPPIEAKIPWFKKPSAFKELSSASELEAAISPQGNGGRLTVIDFYAGWCACCKSAFPALCRIPSSEFMSQNYNFYKANIEEGDLANYIKRRGVRGIPHVLVFDTDGSQVLGMAASFKKMDALRRNLDTIARTEPGQRDFVLDPNGFVVRR